jgi:predicted nucleic acid-binding protein
VISCLKRRNLVFNPSVEPEIYFNREEMKKWLQKFLTRWLPMKIQVIALFYGVGGAGKTHFLRYTQWHLVKIGEPFVAYIDLRKVASEYDFYLRILDALSNCGFIEDFLNEISNLKDSRSINELTGGVRLGWVAKQLGFDPAKIGFWIYGRLPHTKERWIYSVKEDANISRATLSELLKAFYKMNKRRYPIFLIDHVEDVLSEPPRNYMSKNAKEESIKHLRTVVNYSSVMITLDHDNYSVYKEYFTDFKSSNYSEFELSYLDNSVFEEFFLELRNHIVDTTKLSEVDLVRMSDKERVTFLSYPLTEECIGFMKTLKTKQPGIILTLLNHALKETEEESGREMITRGLAEKAVKTLTPYTLVVCRNCKLKLNQINIDLLPKHNRPGTILDIKCPICNASVQELLPLVLDRIVVDTSALVDLCVSTIFEYLPYHGKSRRVIIYIPKAARSELAHWEKRMDKYSASRSALTELRRIQELKRRGHVNIEDNVGRQPERYEKALARLTDSVDRIIVETAKTLNATLFTVDKLMAENAGAMSVFSILFLKKGGPGGISRTIYRGGV